MIAYIWLTLASTALAQTDSFSSITCYDCEDAAGSACDLTNCKKTVNNVATQCTASDTGCTLTTDSSIDCADCRYDDDDSTACTVSNEASDWDNEFCYYTGTLTDGTPSPSGEGTVRAAKDCTATAYNTQTNCAAEPGCMWTAGSCSNADYSSSFECGLADATWTSAACGTDASDAFNVCDSDGMLRIARFGTGTGSSCTVQVANTDYSQAYSATYAYQRNLARTTASGDSTYYYQSK